MKTLEQLTDEMNEAQDLWLKRERTYLLAKELSDTLEVEVEELEKAYDKAKRAVDMYEEDQIENAEHRRDIQDEIITNNFTE